MHIYISIKSYYIYRERERPHRSSFNGIVWAKRNSRVSSRENQGEELETIFGELCNKREQRRVLIAEEEMGHKKSI